MEQEWRRIKGFSNFEVSNEGHVRNATTGVVYSEKARSKTSQYIYVCIKPDCGKRKNVNIHRLVAETFLEKPLNKTQVNHIDGNKKNNRADNLEWVTASENSLHAYRKGLRKSTTAQIQKAIDATRKPVRNKTTGEVFRSAVDAAKAIGGNDRGVGKVVRGERKRYMGMEFEFAQEVVTV